MMSRTPVLILNELMIRRSITPRYDVLSIEGRNTHKPVFHYRVIAGEVSACGKAGTKKDAKHEAAKLALEKFAELGIYHPAQPSPINSPCAPSSPVHQPVNAISSLQEMCSENNIPTPEFILIADIGPAHLRQFTMQCNIVNMVVSATDSTKKKAKQLAAQKMLQRLVNTLPEVLAEFNASNLRSTVPAILPPEDVITAYSELTQLNKRKLNWGMKITCYPNTLTALMKEKKIEHSKLWKDIEERSIENLKSLLEMLELTMTLSFIENEKNIIACISIDSDPEFVLANVNSLKDEAIKSVLEEAFDFLSIMTK